MLSSKENKVKGSIFASLTALFQGLEASLIPLILIVPTFILIKNNYSVEFTASILSIKELFTFIISFVVMGYSTFLSSLKKMKKRNNRNFMYSAIFGTTMGNIFFSLAVVLTSSTYGIILTSLYPLFSIILSYIILKEKDINNFFIFGAILTISSGILFVLLPILFANNNQTWDTKKIVGVICGMLSAFMWAIEGIFIKIGFNNKTNLNQKEIIFTRTFFSTITTFILFLPLSIIMDGKINNVYTKIFPLFFMDWKVMLILFGISINLIILRITHTTSLKFLTPRIVSIIDSNNILIPPIIAIIFSQISGLEYYKDEQIIWWAFFLILPILLGVFLTIYSKRVNTKVLEHDH